MPRILDPKNVRYLAFEGGGGKGTTFLGAIRALEDSRLGILPIKSGGQIRGVSGSSAGAITALFLALGWDSDELGKLLARNAEFVKFFDPPSNGYYRVVTEKNRPDKRGDPADTRKPEEAVARNQKDNFLFSTGLAALVARKIKAELHDSPDASPSPLSKYPLAIPVLEGMSLLRDDAAPPAWLASNPAYPMIAALYKSIPSYLYNFLYDRGIFPGFAVRQFFEKWIAFSIIKKWPSEAKKHGIKSQGDGSKVDFLKFRQITGVDLAITGTNVTRQRPMYFSRERTPLFPVSEAVGISMNLPLLFKPVWCDGSGAEPALYRGFWVDGGVLNNLPIHAFDAEQGKKKLGKKSGGSDPDLLPLDPQILALRLVDGYPGKTPRTGDKPGAWDTLLTYLGDIAGTVMYPAEEGQIRTESERDQTIELFTYDLATLDFAPPTARSKLPQEEAEAAVLEYFFLKKKK